MPEVLAIFVLVFVVVTLVVALYICCNCVLF